MKQLMTEFEKMGKKFHSYLHFPQQTLLQGVLLSKALQISASKPYKRWCSHRPRPTVIPLSQPMFAKMTVQG